MNHHPWLLGALFTAALTQGLRAETVVVEEGAALRYLANTSDPGLGMTWTDPAFPAGGWASGVYGVGYEAGGGAEALIATTVAEGTLSVYTRATFDVPDPSSVTAIALGADYDDAYVAWLNGVEIHRSPFMPGGALDWDTVPTDQHESSNGASPDYRPYEDVTALGLPALRAGTNVLAVAVWNWNDVSSDLVLVPRLVLNPAASEGLERGPYLQTGTPTSVIVQWRTAAAEESVVRYGPTPDDLTLSVGNPALTTEHAVTLSGLAPSTTYYYAIGTSTETRSGGDLSHRFTTSPLVDTVRPLRIWVIGDSGTGNADAARVRDAYDADAGCRETDLWLMLGDNAYDNGTDVEYQRAVFETYPELLRRSVLWPTMGNHDSRSASSATESGVYYDIFTLPRAGEAGGLPSGTEAYYSFDVGNVHVICLDSDDTNLDLAGAMHTWLEADLADTVADWIIAFWHHPPYSKGSHDSDSEGKLVDMRENFVPTLEDGGVDLVLSGHSHSYERTYLLDGHYGDSGSFDLATHALDAGFGRLGTDGPYDKPAGGPAPRAGAVYAVAGSSGKTTAAPLGHPAMRVEFVDLGSLVLEISGRRLDARFIDDAGAIRDDFSVYKGTDVPPRAPFALMATAAGSSAIDLAWTAADSLETGFSIERTIDSLSWSLVGAAGAGVTLWSDSGLDPATTYTYRVRAMNDFGSSLSSDCAAATTGDCASPPALAPEADRACAGEPTSLSCGAAEPGVTYTWDLDGDGVADLSGCDVAHTFPAGGDWPVEVEALRSDGCSATSSLVVTVEPLPLLDPSAGTGCAGDDIGLSCGAAEPGVTYTWDVDDDGAPDLFGCDGVTSFPAAGTYPVRVSAASAAGCVTEDTVMVTVTSGAIPAETTALKLTKAGAGALRLQWSSTPDAGAYRVARGEIGAFYSHTIDDGLGAGACTVLATEHTDPDDLGEPRPYYYLVAGLSDCAGSGPWGRASDGSSRPDPPPSPTCP